MGDSRHCADVGVSNHIEGEGSSHVRGGWSGFSDSGTSPGSRERETDCDVREERPQAKTAIIKDSAQSVVAPEAGTTKDRCGSQSLAPLAQSM